MIETTVGQLVGAEPALKRLAERLLPPRVAYPLAGLVAQVAVETGRFAEMRERIAKQYGDVRDATPEERPTMGPKVVNVPNANLEAFGAAVAELVTVPVRLTGEPFDLHALGDERIASADIALMGPLVTMNGTGE